MKGVTSLGDVISDSVRLEAVDTGRGVGVDGGSVWVSEIDCVGVLEDDETEGVKTLSDSVVDSSSSNEDLAGVEGGRAMSSGLNSSV